MPLQVIYHYNLGSAVPLEGDASYAEIAKFSGLDESLCRRFIRASIGSNIFDEDVKTGRVFHTAYVGVPEPACAILTSTARREHW